MSLPPFILKMKSWFEKLTINKFSRVANVVRRINRISPIKDKSVVNKLRRKKKNITFRVFRRIFISSILLQ